MPKPARNQRPLPLAGDPVTARTTHPLASPCVRQQAADAIGDSRYIAPAHDMTGDALDDGIGSAAAVAGHDWKSAGIGLQVDDPQALDLETAEPAAARHGEDVTRGVVRGQLRERHRPGENDIGREPALAY